MRMVVVKVCSWRSPTLCTAALLYQHLSFLHISKLQALPPLMLLEAQHNQTPESTKQVKHSVHKSHPRPHSVLFPLQLKYCILCCFFSRLFADGAHIKTGPWSLYNSLPLLPEHQHSFPMEAMQRRAQRGVIISGSTAESVDFTISV